MLDFSLAKRDGNALGMVEEPRQWPDTMCRTIWEPVMDERSTEPIGSILDELLRQTPDLAFIGVGPDGTITDWSGASKELFGWTASEAKGRPFDLIFTSQDKRAGTAAAELEVAAVKGRSEDDRWHQRRDGGIFWGSGVTQAIRDDSGALKAFCKFVRDRTDLRTQIRGLETQASRAQEELAELHKHVHGIARELHEVVASPTFSASLDTASFQVLSEKLSSLIPQDVLGSAVKVRVELQAALAEAVAQFGAAGKLPEGALQLVVPSAALHVNCNQQQLTILLGELLTNSRSLAGDTKLTVSLSIEGSSAVIRFESDGTGLQPPQLQLVFQLLCGGNQPGMASDKQLVARIIRIRDLARAQGGLVEVRSLGEDAGSTFVLRLPVSPTEVADWNSIDAAMKR